MLGWILMGSVILMGWGGWNHPAPLLVLCEPQGGCRPLPAPSPWHCLLRC